MSDRHECCVLCDDLTGRAGAGDDSLYRRGAGPLCQACYDTALAQPARAQERCHRDNGLCYVGEGDDAHWRCGTSQCGTRRPASTQARAQAGVAELVAKFRAKSAAYKADLERNQHRYAAPYWSGCYEAAMKAWAEAADALAALGGEDG